MDLVLWRHAEAEEGSDDLARVLTRRGHKQASQMAYWLRQHLPKDYVLLASEARRAQQTAAYLGKQFEILPALNPGASWDQVLRAVKWPQGARTVVLVGHQPYLGCVAAMLLSEQPLFWSVKKGSIWWLSHKKHGEIEQVRLKTMLPVSMLDHG